MEGETGKSPNLAGFPHHHLGVLCCPWRNGGMAEGALWMILCSLHRILGRPGCWNPGRPAKRGKHCILGMGRGGGDKFPASGLAPSPDLWPESEVLRDTRPPTPANSKMCQGRGGLTRFANPLTWNREGSFSVTAQQDDIALGDVITPETLCMMV